MLRMLRGVALCDGDVEQGCGWEHGMLASQLQRRAGTGPRVCKSFPALLGLSPRLF